MGTADGAHPVQDAAHFQAPQALSLEGLLASAPADDKASWQRLGDLVVAADQLHASHVIVEPESDFCRVRFRIAGATEEHRYDDPEAYRALATLLDQTLICPADPHECRLLLVNSTQLVRFERGEALRGNAFHLYLDTDRHHPPALDALGFSATQLKVLRATLNEPGGWILVCGRNATQTARVVRASAQALTAPHRRVLCVEQSHFHAMPRTTQLPPDQAQAGVGWLQSAAHEHDAIMVTTTLDDQANCQLPVKATEGAMVVQALRSPTASGALLGLVATGLLPAALSVSLSLVIVHHRLCVLCPACQRPHTPTDSEAHWLSHIDSPEPGGRTNWLSFCMPHHYSDSDGCEQCHDTGIGGTRELYELLELDQVMRQALLMGDLFAALEQLDAGRTLQAELLRLVRSSKISVAEAMRVDELARARRFRIN